MSRLSWLADLSAADLERLEVALVSGRLRPGDDAMVLRSMGLPGAWSVGMAALGDWPAAQLVEVVAAWHATRREPVRVEVVRTQPEGLGLDGVDTATALRRLLSQARSSVWIAGFRLTDATLFAPLHRPASEALQVRLFIDLDIRVDIFGRHQHPRDPMRWPMEWYDAFLQRIWPRSLPEPEVFYSPLTLGLPRQVPRSMHVKTVLVDRARWLVTSANFTNRGQTRNFELGALVEDEAAAQTTAEWFEELIGVGGFVRLDRP